MPTHDDHKPMKLAIATHLMKVCSHPTTRPLAVLAAAVLAAAVPANVRAGDDAASTKHARHHESARLRHARHVHYVSDPRHEAPAPSADRVIIQKADDAPLDESLYRSFQERNLVNPG